MAGFEIFVFERRTSLFHKNVPHGTLKFFYKKNAQFRLESKTICVNIKKC